MGAPNYVQVQPNSTGAKVEVEDVPQADGTTVERQRVLVMPQAADIANRRAVEATALAAADQAALSSTRRSFERVTLSSETRGRR